MEVIIMKENFPIDGEAYAVGKQGNRYFFTWGYEFPYREKMPGEDVVVGENGIEWFATEEEALSSYLDAVEAVNVTFGSPLMQVMTAREAEKRWGLQPGTIRNSCTRGPLKKYIIDGHIRKSAGTWLVTKEVMEEVYGIEGI